MKSLITTLLIFGVLLCLMNGCMNDSIGSIAYSTTITVVDSDNKPLSGQKVKLVHGYGVRADTFSFSSRNQSRYKWDSTVTDNLGKAMFNYELTISESHQDYAAFATEEDKVWKNIEMISHTMNENHSNKSVNSLNFTLRKDSLVPLSVRVQRANNSVGGISFGVYSDELQTYSNSNGTESRINSRNFFTWSNESVMLVDTTFAVKVYSKASCNIASSTLLVQGNNKFWMPHKSIKFNPYDFKTKELVLQF